MRLPLTLRHREVLAALTDEFTQPGIIAREAHITTRWETETTARYCIQLVKLGLAEKGGTAKFPKWRRMPIAALGIEYHPAECWFGCEDQNCPSPHQDSWTFHGKPYTSYVDATLAKLTHEKESADVEAVV